MPKNLYKRVPAGENKWLFGLKEIAAHCRLSVSTVSLMRKNHGLPMFRMGRAYISSPWLLDQFLLAGWGLQTQKRLDREHEEALAALPE